MHLKGTDISPSVFSWGAAEQTPAIFLGMYDGYLVDAEGNYALDEENAIAALEQMASLLDYNPEGADRLEHRRSQFRLLDRQSGDHDLLGRFCP